MKSLWKIAVVLVVIGLGVSGYFYWKAKNNYQTVFPKWGPIVEAVYGIGTVTSSQVYQVKYGVAATLEDIYVKEGDQVKKGDRLMKVDRQIIKSPFDGTVTSVPFNLGENVFAQAVLMTVTDLAHSYLLVSLEQQGALRVKAGQNVHISFDSLRGRKFSGRVRTIYPSADQFLARVDVEDLPGEILPGMTADVAIEVARKENVQLIPVQAVAQGKITLLESGRRKRLDVKVGNIDGQWAEVLSPDLDPKSLIVVRTSGDR